MNAPSPRPSNHPAAFFFLTCGVILLAALAWPLHAAFADKSGKAKGINNCRQVIITLRLYAGDNSGTYPDAVNSKPRTANEAFRELFINGEATDEMIFGCPDSPFVPDGKIGRVPDFTEAMKKGENHWALVAGMTDSVAGDYPLLCENPLNAAVPPRWDVNSAGQAKPGRCWSDNTIIIGFNDGSVVSKPLHADPGDDLGLLKPFSGDAAALAGKPIFFGGDPDNHMKLHLLQVEP